MPVRSMYIMPTYLHVVVMLDILSVKTETYQIRHLANELQV